jgi:hypothetical protein
MDGALRIIRTMRTALFRQPVKLACNCPPS